MKRQLRAILLMLIIFSSMQGRADDMQSAIVNRLKEQTLNEIMPSLEVREGGMCLFLPKGKNFITKVAINCSRLFDTLLDDLIMQSDSPLFSKDSLKNIASPNVYRRMLDILQGDFTIIRGVLASGGSIESESLSPVIPEVAKLIKLAHQGVFGFDQKNSELFSQILKKYGHELFLLISNFGNEESFSSLIEHIKGLSDDNETSELKMYFIALKGTRDELVSYIVDLIKKSNENASSKLESLTIFKDSLEQKKLSIVYNVVSYLDNCLDASVRNNVCEGLYNKLEPEIKSYLDENNTRAKVEGIFSSYKSDLRELHSQLMLISKKDSKYYELIDEVVRPHLTSLKYLTQEDLVLACEILGDEKCTLKLDSSLELTGITNSPYFRIFIVLFAGALGVLLLLGVCYLFYKKLLVFKKPKTSSLDQNSPDDLNTEERSELRNLRQVFELKPTDGVSELHRSYRRMVFNVHPDKLKDGGREFVELQARYLKTKELLDRLDNQKANKIVNK